MKNFETQILKHHFYLKKSIRFSVILMLLSFLAPVLNAQPTITVTGSAVNRAGNSAIPSTLDGGCASSPQTPSPGGAPGADWVGGTVFAAPATPPPGTCAGGYTLSSVRLNLTHTWTGDLDIFLRNRTTGAIIALSTGNGGSGNDFANTVFCDNAACASVTGGAAPFTSTFRPEGVGTGFCAGEPVGTIATLSGFTLVGGHIYELIIYDGSGGDFGAMISWSLVFAAAPPALVVTPAVTFGLAPGMCTVAPLPCLAADVCIENLRFLIGTPISPA